LTQRRLSWPGLSTLLSGQQIQRRHPTFTRRSSVSKRSAWGSTVFFCPMATSTSRFLGVALRESVEAVRFASNISAFKWKTLREHWRSLASMEERPWATAWTSHLGMLPALSLTTSQTAWGLTTRLLMSQVRVGLEPTNHSALIAVPC